MMRDEPFRRTVPRVFFEKTVNVNNILNRTTYIRFVDGAKKTLDFSLLILGDAAPIFFILVG